MTISATVAVADLTEASRQLEEAGHGPNNFSVELHKGNAPATHMGLHAWDDDNFIAALEAVTVSSLVIRHEPGSRVNFADHISERGLEKMRRPEDKP